MCTGLLVVSSVLAAAFAAINQSPAAFAAINQSPSKLQLEEVKRGFQRIGASYESTVDNATKQTRHGFWFPESAGDNNLEQIPDVPFAFSLRLAGTKITDAGLKKIKSAKNLVALDLGFTDVTDAGVRELKDIKSLESLSLWVIREKVQPIRVRKTL